MRRDPVIIGGGPAGCAAAITLARAGHRPILLERSTGPTDKVCGDFLSAETVESLISLGIDPRSFGAAPIRRVRITRGGQTAETTLPFAAMGLSRRILDEALLNAAGRAGADIRRGETVRSLTPGWTAQTGTRTLQSGTMFLATGKHDLRDLPRDRSAKGSIGIKLYFRPGPDIAGAVELVLFPGGYAGVQPVGDGQAVLCVAVGHAAFPGSWPALLALIRQSSARFAALLDAGGPLTPRPMAVAGIPYGYQSPAALPGLFRLGDQAAVIPSLTGDGMAIAVHSGTQAAQTWLSGCSSAEYQAELGRMLGTQMRFAGLLHGAGMLGPVQPLAVMIGRLFPGLLRYAARRTRLRPAGNLLSM